MPVNGDEVKRLFAAVLVVLLGGCDRVVEVEVSPDPIECRAGETIQLVAQPKTKKGKISEDPLAWSLDGNVGTLSHGKLSCETPGEGKVTVKSGEVTKTVPVKVRSPLEGLWRRTGDDKAGLTVEIRATSDGFIGEIIEPVGPEADKHLAAHFEISPEKAKRVRRCIAGSWSPGLRKWIDFKDAGKNRWSIKDLHKNVIVISGGGVCWEHRDETEHKDGFELEVKSLDELVLRNTKVKGGQTWHRVPDDEQGPPSSDFREVLDAWVEAQSTQDFLAYKKLYAPDFKGIKTSPSGTKEFDREDWLEDRQGMFGKDFRLFVGEVKEDASNPEGPTLSFEQDWVSSNYADTGRKTIVLTKAGDNWLIVREEQLEAQQTWPVVRKLGGQP